MLQFRQFEARYGKNYVSVTERMHRYRIFRENLARVAVRLSAVASSGGVPIRLGSARLG
jgi:hypothetical protein